MGEKAEKGFFFRRKMFFVKNLIYVHTHTHIKYIQCNCNCCAKHWEVPPWSMYFWSFKQLSYNSCILVRLGQVAPDKPLATHIQAEASAFTVRRKKCVFVSGVGAAGREWAGGSWRLQVRKKELASFYFSTTIFDANPNPFSI